ncbi:ABC transporter permease [Anoxybacillus sp. D401a]|uniref:ABC transporter permease n=1 Tax=Anoxybacillus sp. D401a TaxID=575112 RepID=UPI003D344572
MSFLQLVLAEIKRSWRVRKNYPLSFLMNMIQSAVFLGVSIVIISKISTVDQAISVLLWPIAITAIGSICTNIQEDIQLGTLERVIFSRYSFLTVILSRLVSDIFFLTPFIFVALIGFIFFINVNVPFFSIFITAIIILLTGVGIGLILSGLLIFYKNIGPLPNLLMLISMTAMVLPWSKWDSFLHVFGIFVFPFVSIALFIQTDNNLYLLMGFVNALFYIVVGLLIFNWLFALAKRKKGLSAY